MKSFSRTLTLPLMIAALTGCGGSSGSDNGNEISQSGDISSLLTEGLSRLRFSNDFGVERSPLIRFESRLENSTFSTATQLFNGSSWDDISEENITYDLSWNGSEWVANTLDGSCQVQAPQTSGKLTIECADGNPLNISVTGTSLAGEGVKALLEVLLDNTDEEEELEPEIFTAITTAISEIDAATVFGANARSYEIQYENINVSIELGCDPINDNVPSVVSDFSCANQVGAETFEEVFDSETSFTLESQNSSDEYEYNLVYLERDGSATSGIIRLDNGEGNGNSLGVWQLVNITDDVSIIRLNPTSPGSTQYNALIMLEDQVYQGYYSEAGTIRSSGPNYNAAAIADIVAVLEGKAPFVTTQP